MGKKLLIRFVLPAFTILFTSLLYTLPAQAAAFAKFDGIDGESQDANHDKWIDVLSISEGISRPGGGATGQSRRRGAAEFEDLVIVHELDKASVKLREKLAQGEVIPKLDIELTANYGGARATYFKYELKNVMITSIQLDVSGSDSVPAIERIAVDFEEIKWTYTEYDSEGNKGGNVEATWKVEKGEK